MTEHSEEFIETYERAAKALRENDKETTLQIIKEAREEQINLSAKYRQHTAEELDLIEYAKNNNTGLAAKIFLTMSKEDQAAFLRL